MARGFPAARHSFFIESHSANIGRPRMRRAAGPPELFRLRMRQTDIGRPRMRQYAGPPESFRFRLRRTDIGRPRMRQYAEQPESFRFRLRRTDIGRPRMRQYAEQAFRHRFLRRLPIWRERGMVTHPVSIPAGVSQVWAGSVSMCTSPPVLTSIPPPIGRRFTDFPVFFPFSQDFLIFPLVLPRRSI